MDQIIVHNQVAIGLLAVVYKVTKKDDKTNTPLILKEVECQDMKYAEKAQNEYRLFHSLRHRYICTLKDSFVKWDAKLSSPFVCYVMEYFENADLMTLLNDMRNKKEMVSFEVLEKWIAYIIESVNFLHKNKIIHANIKPSSFYLKQVEKSNEFELLIGDYGVPTIMKDARTKTRIIKNAFDYAGPEIIDGQPFDFKSDIWSIGATLLDICTTSIYDYKEFHSHLLNIRFDDELLKKILDDIFEVYKSKSLIRFLELTLRKIEDRVSISALINNTFVQACLEKIDSELIIHLNTHIRDFSHKLPQKPSIEILSDFAQKNILDEGLVQAAILKITELLDEEVFDLFDDKNQSLLIKIMHDYSQNEKIQLGIFKIVENSLGLKAKEKLLKNESQNNIEPLYLKANFVKKFFYLFLKHEYVKEIQVLALKTFIHLSNFENITTQLASFDIIKYILEMFEKFFSDARVCGYICKSIWSLCINDSVLATLKNHKCLPYLRKCILVHRDDLFCSEMAVNAVIALCSNERQMCREELDIDITSAILVSLNNNLECATFVKSACIALAALISFMEDCGFRFLYLSPSDINEKEIDGINVLKNAYLIHKDERDVVECICNVFKELSSYDEMVVEMKSVKLNETLINEISRRFRDNLNISQMCYIVNSKIENQAKASIISTNA